MKRIVLSVCAVVVAVCAADMMTLGAFAASADAEGAVRYVKTAVAGGSDELGDGTVEKPFATPQKAVAALGAAGGTVEIAAGVYVLTDEIFLAAPVTLHGASRESTVFDCADASIRCVVSNANAKVSGLTLMRSKTYPVLLCGGRVEDCIVTGCAGGFKNSTSHCASWKAPVISRCIISNNTGSAVTQSFSNPNKSGLMRVDNCLIVESPRSGGYAVNADHDEVTVTNCTFVSNASLVYANWTSATLVNCIVSGASEKNGSGTLSFRNTCFYNNTSTNGLSVNECIRVDTTEQVFFKNCANGDYHLQSMSPCINRGLAVPHLPQDLDGCARMSGAAPDMGCYEADLAKPTCALSWNTFYTFATVPLTGTVTVMDDGSGRTYDYDVTFTEPTSGTKVTANASPFAANFSVPGRYDVSIVATDKNDPDYRATYSASADLYIAPLTNYVTKQSITAGTFPYDTPAKATSDIRAAFGATLSRGSTVAFVKGTHVLDREIFLDCPVTLAGAGGKEGTILDCANANIRCVVVSNANAKVSGLTLTRSKTYPVLLCGGRVEDCIVTDSAGGFVNSIAHCEYWKAPVVSRCIISNNTGSAVRQSFSSPNKSGLICVDNCLIVESPRSGGSAVYVDHDQINCTNCTFVSNGSFSGGVWGPVVFVNCVASGAVQNGGVAPSFLNTCFYDNTSTNGLAVNAGCVRVDTTDEVCFRNYANGDYRLKRKSPCVAAGAFAGNFTGWLDLDGESRTCGTKPRNRSIDMGCYQSQYRRPGFFLSIR